MNSGGAAEGEAALGEAVRGAAAPRGAAHGGVLYLKCCQMIGYLVLITVVF